MDEVQDKYVNTAHTSGQSLLYIIEADKLDLENVDVTLKALFEDVKKFIWVNSENKKPGCAYKNWR